MGIVTASTEPSTDASTLARSGIIGAGLILLGAAISAVLFEHNGYHYSPLGCFISELGDVEHARGHAAFNGGLMLGAPAMAYFMFGLGTRFLGWLPWLARIAGGAAATGGFFVGLYPMNRLAEHITAANTFFYGGMVAVFLYSLAIFRAKGEIPRGVAGFGGFVVLMFAAFLFLPLHFYVGPKPTLFEAGPYQHPDFWLIAFVEWMVLLSVLGWVLTVSALLLRRSRTSAGSQA